MVSLDSSETSGYVIQALGRIQVRQDCPENLLVRDLNALGCAALVEISQPFVLDFGCTLYRQSILLKKISKYFHQKC